ncbi:DUF1080 domain-containing protein [Chryseolinea sp. H1M3-3]|uniref:3-keto-disaccharide hydrolase n=1 Tax=Chryseolinea sp. H1M3-3 TaxID=3034144 RepID=UPI0023EDD13A|nr:DUF1080 domain-containing protein [Chryseolinea sp. H1M3-3]
MHYYFYWFSLAFIGCVFSVQAQMNESLYTTMALQDLKEFKPTNGNWKIAKDVFYDWKEAGKAKITGGTGIVVNDISDKAKDHLITTMEHGDIDLELDFMMEKGSNAGVYLQGRYEVQMFDSWGISPVKATDCGAIYERWDDKRPPGKQGYEGHPPAQNVSKAPGLWQHYRIEFRAPRFDASGKKIENARFIKVVHNGVVIHENVEVTGPTRAAIFSDEKSVGPLVIQGDHGPVAIRNIKFKAYGQEKITLSDLKLNAYEGRFSSLTELNAAKPVATVDIDLLQHQGTETMDYYGGKISGTIHIPKSGKYFMNLHLKWIPDDTNPTNPNGGGELKIDNKVVMSLDGRKTGRASAVVDLEAGNYPVELNYYKKFQHWYQQANDIVFGVETNGIAYTNLNSVLLFAEAVGAITLPVGQDPVMLRSFVNHKGKKKTHVISVGEPTRIGYSYDLSSGSVLQYWRGDFVETTQMWYGRGEPQLAVPLGSVIESSGRPTVAMLRDKSEVWPDSNTNYSYIGYDISKTGNPIIKYSIGKTQIKELLSAEDSGHILAHTITLASSDGTPVWCRIAEGSAITKLPNGLYAINDKQFYIQLPDKSEPVIRGASGAMELLIPMKSKDNAGSLKYNIIW